jgi:hypothetical protein
LQAIDLWLNESDLTYFIAAIHIMQAADATPQPGVNDEVRVLKAAAKRRTAPDLIPY